MNQRNFSGEPIVAIVKQQEAGMAVADRLPVQWIYGATSYQWNSKSGGP